MGVGLLRGWDSWDRGLAGLGGVVSGEQAAEVGVHGHGEQGFGGAGAVALAGAVFGALAGGVGGVEAALVAGPLAGVEAVVGAGDAGAALDGRAAAGFPAPGDAGAGRFHVKRRRKSGPVTGQRPPEGSP